MHRRRDDQPSAPRSHRRAGDVVGRFDVVRQQPVPRRVLTGLAGQMHDHLNAVEQPGRRLVGQVKLNNGPQRGHRLKAAARPVNESSGYRWAAKCSTKMRPMRPPAPVTATLGGTRIAHIMPAHQTARSPGAFTRRRTQRTREPRDRRTTTRSAIQRYDSRDRRLLTNCRPSPRSPLLFARSSGARASRRCDRRYRGQVTFDERLAAMHAVLREPSSPIDVWCTGALPGHVGR